MRQLRPMSLMNTFDTIHSRDAPPTAITAICRTSIAPGAQHNFPSLQALALATPLDEMGRRVTVIRGDEV